MTTPQKAAMHLEDWLKVGSQQDTGLTQQNCKALHKWAEKLCEALTTLRENQGCAVVTVEELLQERHDRDIFEGYRGNFEDAHVNVKQAFKSLARHFPNGLVIAPEKKETP